MTDLLAQALTAPDTDAPIDTGRLAAFAQDGTCTVDLGAGRVLPGVLRPSGVTLGVGDAVLLTRCGPSKWVVLCRPATTAPATIPAAESWVLPRNILGAAGVGAPNPLVVGAVGAGSWAFNKWSDSEVKQGYYSSSGAWRQGVWWFGAGAFDAIRGRRCDWFTLTVSRPDAGGRNTTLPVYVRLHLDPVQPGGAPTWHPDGGVAVTGPAWSQSDDLALPAAYGQALIDGTAAGVGVYYTGSADYAIYNPGATVKIGWA